MSPDPPAPDGVNAYPAVHLPALPRCGMRIVCWGPRGSAPSPSAETVRFGGHTCCIEVRADSGRSLVFDAGSGIAPLGRYLAAHSAMREVDLFLTHYHWDHIQGLPFFEPLHNPAWTVRIHGEPVDGMSVEALLSVQMAAPFFPLGLQQVFAGVEYFHIENRAWNDAQFEVTPFRVRHPGHTYAFRIRCDGATVVYMPDNEPAFRGFDLGDSWEADLVEFLRGADLLLHDGMYTEAEYASRHGWGHGTFEQAVALAEAALVPQLLLFHHAPHRQDDELHLIVGRLRREREAAGVYVDIDAAAQGREYAVVPALRDA
jgi:phosphoribosyl 1,2-cyclic phosphodiesterase